MISEKNHIGPSYLMSHLGYGGPNYETPIDVGSHKNRRTQVSIRHFIVTRTAKVVG